MDGSDIPNFDDNADERINPDDVEEAVAEDDVLGADQNEDADDVKMSPAMEEALNAIQEDDSVQGFFDHKDAVYSVALNPANQKQAVSGGGDDKSYIWDITEGEIVYTLDGHTDSVIDTAFSYDGKYVASGSMDGTVRIYTAADGKFLHALEGPASEIEWIEWHHKGHVVLAGSSDNSAWLWNAVNGQVLKVFSGHLGPVLSGCFTADGKLVVTGSEDGTLFIWDPKTGNSKHHLKGHLFHEGPVTAVASHPDPTQHVLMSGSQDTAVKIIHSETGKILMTLKGHSDGVETVDFCKAMPWAASGALDGEVVVWDVRTGQTRAKFEHDDAVTQVMWHPTEPLLYSASVDRTVRLLDARSGNVVETFKGHQDGILGFALSNDGNTLITSSDDRTCLVFQRGQSHSAVPEATPATAAVATGAAPAKST